MELQADFEAPVLLHTDVIDWVASPMPGVHRRMLDRLGDEVARATSIVRYAPGSSFSPHTHSGGEEFLVLEGTFQDEHGDYPVGSYVRNPPESSHTPGAAEGCVIFVKLWQFDAADRTAVTLRPEDQAAPIQTASGISETLLHTDERERVMILHLEPGTPLRFNYPDGAELLVLSGGLMSEQGGATVSLRTGSWLRLPCQSELSGITGVAGARVWMKTGHLKTPPVAPSSS